MKKLFIFFVILISLISLILLYEKSMKSIRNVTDIRNIKIEDVTYLTGVNMWTYSNVLEVLLNIGEYEDLPSDKIEHFYENLSQTLPSLKYHECSGGFLERVKDGTYMGHILEHIILELQNFSGSFHGTGRTRETEKRGVYKMVVSDEQEDRLCIMECLDCGIDLLGRLLNGEKGIKLYPYRERIRKINLDRGFGSNLLSIIYSFSSEEIPYFKISNSGGFVQLGYGNQQRRLWISTTDNTIGIAESIVSDKDFTKKLLKEQGINVPLRHKAKNIKNIKDIQDIQDIQDIDKKDINIVIKPYNSNHGRGLTLNIDRKNKKMVEKAFYHALDNNKGNEDYVLVENYIQGECYRILVINHKVVACCKTFLKTFHVKIIGNGKDSLEEMINEEKTKIYLDNCYNHNHKNDNIYYFCSENYFKYYKLIEYIEKIGKSMYDIPSHKEEITIELVYDQYMNINISEISSFIIEKCVLSTKIVGLDVCGIDIIIPLLSKDNKEYTILELNAGPDLRIHKNIGKEMVNYLFPESYSFPMIGITGDGDRSFVNRFISTFLNNIGWNVGSYGESGLFIGKKEIESKDKDNHIKNIKKVLMNNEIDSAVFDQSSDIIEKHGIGYRYATAIILGNVVPKTKTMINELPNSIKTVRVQLDIVSNKKDISNCSKYSILNGNDPSLNDLEEFVDNKENIIYYIDSSKENYIKNDRKNNKKVIFDKDIIILKNGNDQSRILYPFIPNKKMEYIASLAGLWSFINLFDEKYIL